MHTPDTMVTQFSNLYMDAEVVLKTVKKVESNHLTLTTQRKLGAWSAVSYYGKVR